MACAAALGWLGGFARDAGSALVDGGAALPDRADAEIPGDEDTAAAVWVPARNVVLIAAASAAAEAHGASVVLAGFNSEEAATFPDNSQAFVEAFDRVLSMGTQCGVVVESPTVGMTKRDIVATARRLGLEQDDFWSCYDAGPTSCGRCESCTRSVAAWALDR